MATPRVPDGMSEQSTPCLCDQEDRTITGRLDPTLILLSLSDLSICECAAAVKNIQSYIYIYKNIQIYKKLKWSGEDIGDVRPVGGEVMICVGRLHRSCMCRRDAMGLDLTSHYCVVDVFKIENLNTKVQHLRRSSSIWLEQL